MKRKTSKKKFAGSRRLGCVFICFLRLIFYQICNFPPFGPSSFSSHGIGHLLRFLGRDSIGATVRVLARNASNWIFAEFLKFRRRISYWRWEFNQISRRLLPCWSQSIILTWLAVFTVCHSAGLFSVWHVLRPNHPPSGLIFSQNYPPSKSWSAWLVLYLIFISPPRPPSTCSSSGSQSIWVNIPTTHDLLIK